MKPGCQKSARFGRPYCLAHMPHASYLLGREGPLSRPSQQRRQPKVAEPLPSQPGAPESPQEPYLELTMVASCGQCGEPAEGAEDGSVMVLECLACGVQQHDECATINRGRCVGCDHPFPFELQEPARPMKQRGKTA
jgi:hypothetical protein